MSVRLNLPRTGSKAPSDVSTWLHSTRRATPTRIELWSYEAAPRKLGTWPGNLATLADEVSATMAKNGQSLNGYGLLAYVEKGKKADKAFSIAWVRRGVLSLIREKTKDLDEALFLHLIRTLEITGKGIERVNVWRADLGLDPVNKDEPAPTTS